MMARSKPILRVTKGKDDSRMYVEINFSVRAAGLLLLLGPACSYVIL